MNGAEVIEVGQLMPEQKSFWLEFLLVKTTRRDLALHDFTQPGHVGAGERPVSRGWALLHALEHGYLHPGHIQITRQLWEAHINTQDK